MISIQLNFRYTFILIFSAFLSLAGYKAKAQEDAADTTGLSADTVKPKPVVKEKSGRHLSLNLDLYHPVMSMTSSQKSGYEFAADYYTNHDLYVVAEGGWGSSKVDYPDLKYKTKNNFARFGVNRTLLYRYDSSDWDNLFIGARLSAADIQRTNANFVVTDTFWGPGSGATPGKDFMAYWIEIVLGVRVSVMKDVFLGWTFRAKFMLNGRSFNDLAPIYIAGYGRGDKNSAFDFDFYLTYSINWKRKYQRIGAAPIVADSVGRK